MTTLRHILWVCPLCALPVAVGQVEGVANAPDLCCRLVEKSREVDRLLRTVSDQESGNKAAAELKPMMEYLHREIGRLSQLPIESAEAARTLEQSMRDLMHITQGFMPVVQRLNEVNAYGAEELMQLFRFYKMNTPSSLVSDRRDETPLVRNYGEWGDSMDDVVYLMRRVSDHDSAAALMPDIQGAVQRMEDRAAQVDRLQNEMNPHQMEAERLPMERMMRLNSELRAEVERLQKVQGYGVAGMKPLLERCSRASRY